MLTCHPLFTLADKAEEPKEQSSCSLPPLEIEELRERLAAVSLNLRISQQQFMEVIEDTFFKA